MIANYSSFLEFIAAVYCTIWIDNIVTQKVWTPRYIDSLRKAIEGVQFAGNTSLSTEIIESNTERGNELQLRSSKTSMFMIFIIAFLLIFSGYEQGFKGNIEMLHLPLLYSFLVGMTLTLLLFNRLIFSKWKWTICAIIINLAIFVCIYYWELFYGKSKIERVLNSQIGLLVSIILILPIFWQIFICWIYGSAFVGYIKTQLTEQKGKYEEAIHNIEKGCTEEVSEEYKKIILKKATENKDEPFKNTLDKSINEYAEILKEQITKTCRDISAWKIFISWCVFQLQYISSSQKVENVEKTDAEDITLASALVSEE